jgi:hypothetical protein
MDPLDPAHPDPIQAADSLEKAMKSLGSQIEGLKAYGERNRILIQVAVAGLVLLALLLGGLGLVAWQAHTASDKATAATSATAQNEQAQRASCEAGNQARQVQIQLWTYILDLAQRSTQQTPAQRQQLDQFRTYLRTTFASRDCTPHDD